MSTWTSIKVGGFSLREVQNTYDSWFFLSKDRVREVELNAIEEGIPKGSIIGYRATVGQIRRRMAIQGYDMEGLENHFNNELQAAIENVSEQIEDARSSIGAWEGSDTYYGQRIDTLEKILMAISGSTLADWIRLLPKASAWPIEEYEMNRWQDTGDNLLSAMLYNCYQEPLYALYGTFNFPCSDESFFDLAVLSVFSDDTFCELDLTELIYSERAEDFRDLEEIAANSTRPCRSVLASLDDFKSLSDSAPLNLVLQRMCYSSIITAVEAYLSDIMKRAVQEDSVRRRFVERYKPFQKDTKMDLSSLFITLDKIDRLIAEALDSILYHDLEKVRGIFKDVLLVSFPEKDRAFLNRAVQLRHDIVHRNGRTTTGKAVSVAHQDVGQLDKVVRDFIVSVDSQILDGLRLADTEDTQG
ncbi:HEPN/Toprim-associated domain-containing protein [Kosakonia radicincitans]|uniref:HEPN/Toprim-associated domain-containing protein n=1 Tax=Kosakonia radicincitans TaxID=283686 RepID=UPI0023686D1D|nr:HEPN/Toprim-associated domain-containing protein [Kosakonia radicincitans]MDD7998251.1 HEPN/Toprim-associated domain-containing protein [Kosakonia radicincitans]